MLFALLCYASLADPVYDVRESATLHLTHLVDRYPSIYGPRLGEWVAASTCPETRRRAGKFLS